AVCAEHDAAERAFIGFGNTGSPDRARKRPQGRHLRSHPGALHAIKAHPDRAAILLLTLIDRNVIHPHPVLLWDRRGVREAHRVAVVEDLSFACRLRPLGGGNRRLFLVIDGKIVATIGRLLRRRREIRLSVWVFPVEDLAGRGGLLGSGCCGCDWLGGDRKSPATCAEPIPAQDEGHRTSGPDNESGGHGNRLHLALKTIAPSTVSVSPGTLACSLSAQRPAMVKSALNR